MKTSGIQCKHTSFVLRIKSIRSTIDPNALLFCVTAHATQNVKHDSTLKIPFHTSEHALIARRALDVDREQNGSLVRREMNVEGDVLIV